MALSHRPTSNVVIRLTSNDPEHVVVDADDNVTFAASEDLTITPGQLGLRAASPATGECIGHFMVMKALSDADGDSETLTVTIAVVADQTDDDFDNMDSITINVKTWDDEYWCSRDTPPSCEGEYN